MITYDVMFVKFMKKFFFILLCNIQKITKKDMSNQKIFNNILKILKNQEGGFLKKRREIKSGQKC